MKVYHGSKAKFDRFDGRFIGTNGTMEGQGFYFTDSRRIAEGYGESGYLYTVQFKGKKPLSSEQMTIQDSELRIFLAALHEEMDYLSNWGEVDFDGYEKVMRIALQGERDTSHSDVELMGGICNASGNTARALEIMYESLGYDSIIQKADWGEGQMLYIALVNEAVEIIGCEQVPARKIKGEN